ncbi:protein of unknown function [Oenococcus oeni]|nr:hypothetical protein OENI_390007 [Oenococcus oeni]SYW18922.1 hypothetical protein OENI_60067 [Oenococcus oeni]VDC13776.1 protein of unknown function [Oenococcus oeni]
MAAIPFAGKTSCQINYRKLSAEFSFKIDITDSFNIIDLFLALKLFKKICSTFTI